VYESSDHVLDAFISYPAKCHAAVGKLKAKVKIVPVQGLKARGRVAIYLHALLTSVLGGNDW
jgi:hypothetical protein